MGTIKRARCKETMLALLHGGGLELNECIIDIESSLNLFISEKHRFSVWLRSLMQLCPKARLLTITTNLCQSI